MVFDSKLFKLISFEKAKKEMLKGNIVYMVKMNGEMEEVTEATNWKSLVFHSIKSGSYAVARKQKLHGLGDFTKNLNIGQWSFEVSHKKKGGDA